nr:envelope protein 2 variant 327 [Hepacivirus hominis]MOZ58239.1 envelope protein 2 variant 444 [Hepacivirus hominis]MOZ58350.1 envelope protein 2 variant 555 [Hepacivirus hominis]MOZ58367.1 envelope protein 2 variant 572 [Hepacivirus hominis]MOZ58368.1 envelope protein 2 variant 573 [Hepacivirus hominis]
TTHTIAGSTARDAFKFTSLFNLGAQQK